MFELSFTKILVLAVVALLIFGPDQLPRVARQAGQALRDLRRIAEAAKADLQEGLGPEFRDFDINDLHPKTFVRKHLWEEFDNGTNGGASGGNGNGHTRPQTAPADSASMLATGESPPYDSEAT
ncbi:MAG TPA: sec-independent translocase [Streptosporangiaceae bacterium]|nr:sec-independent translocase [Streptosporangiaceae bacterium]